jgi:GMP synthase (glutamine-hydrolysing)
MKNGNSHSPKQTRPKPAMADNGTTAQPAVTVPYIAIVQTGQPPECVRQRHGDFPEWFARHLGAEPDQIRVFRAFAGEALPALDDAAGKNMVGVIVTGSPAMITEQPDWSPRVERWLQTVLQRHLPVLGVCYGHQLLAQAAGGQVDWNPRGRQIGQVRFQHTAAAHQDPLFSPLLAEGKEGLSFYATHLQAVQQLPGSGQRLGHSALDPNHAFRLGERAWGVQFHPEFTAAITQSFIDCRAEDIAAEGLCPVSLKTAIDATAEANGQRLLRRFAELCFRRP